MKTKEQIVEETNEHFATMEVGHLAFAEKALELYSEEVGKVLDDFDFMKEVNYICEGMKCPSNEKLHTKEDINNWIRIQQKKEIGI